MPDAPVPDFSWLPPAITLAGTLADAFERGADGWERLTSSMRNNPLTQLAGLVGSPGGIITAPGEIKDKPERDASGIASEAAPAALGPPPTVALAPDSFAPLLAVLERLTSAVTGLIIPTPTVEVAAGASGGVAAAGLGATSTPLSPPSPGIAPTRALGPFGALVAAGERGRGLAPDVSPVERADARAAVAQAQGRAGRIARTPDVSVPAEAERLLPAPSVAAVAAPRGSRLAAAVPGPFESLTAAHERLQGLAPDVSPVVRADVQAGFATAQARAGRAAQTPGLIVPDVDQGLLPAPSPMTVPPRAATPPPGPFAALIQAHERVSGLAPDASPVLRADVQAGFVQAQTRAGRAAAAPGAVIPAAVAPLLPPPAVPRIVPPRGNFAGLLAAYGQLQDTLVSGSLAQIADAKVRVNRLADAGRRDIGRMPGLGVDPLVSHVIEGFASPEREKPGPRPAPGSAERLRTAQAAHAAAQASGDPERIRTAAVNVQRAQQSYQRDERLLRGPDVWAELLKVIATTRVGYGGGSGPRVMPLVGRMASLGSAIVQSIAQRQQGPGAVSGIAPSRPTGFLGAVNTGLQAIGLGARGAGRPGLTTAPATAGRAPASVAGSFAGPADLAASALVRLADAATSAAGSFGRQAQGIGGVGTHAGPHIGDFSGLEKYGFGGLGKPAESGIGAPAAAPGFEAATGMEAAGGTAEGIAGAAAGDAAGIAAGVGAEFLGPVGIVAGTLVIAGFALKLGFDGVSAAIKGGTNLLEDAFKTAAERLNSFQIAAAESGASPQAMNRLAALGVPSGQVSGLAAGVRGALGGNVLASMQLGVGPVLSPQFDSRSNADVLLQAATALNRISREQGPAAASRMAQIVPALAPLLPSLMLSERTQGIRRDDTRAASGIMTDRAGHAGVELTSAWERLFSMFDLLKTSLAEPLLAPIADGLNTLGTGIRTLSVWVSQHGSVMTKLGELVKTGLETLAGGITWFVSSLERHPAEVAGIGAVIKGAIDFAIDGLKRLPDLITGTIRVMNFAIEGLNLALGATIQPLVDFANVGLRVWNFLKGAHIPLLPAAHISPITQPDFTGWKAGGDPFRSALQDNTAALNANTRVLQAQGYYGGGPRFRGALSGAGRAAALESSRYVDSHNETVNGRAIAHHEFQRSQREFGRMLGGASPFPLRS